MRNLKFIFSFCLSFFLAWTSVDAQNCISGPLTINVGQVATYSSNSSAQCANCFDWDVNGVNNQPNDQSQTFNFSSNVAGTFEICVRVFNDNGDCDPCCITVIVDPPLSCCFEYWAVPKYFPSCFTNCTGNLDNVWEIHQKPCNDLPAGFTTAFTNINLNSSATLGNCASCSNPTTTQSTPVNSFNMAVCGPLNHSISFDIVVYNQNNTVVYTCSNEYFSFYVPHCDKKDGPFFDGTGGNDGQVKSLKIRPNPVEDILYFETDADIDFVSIYSLKGDLVKAVNLDQERNLTISDLPAGTFIFYCQYLDGSYESKEFVKR